MKQAALILAVLFSVVVKFGCSRPSSPAVAEPRLAHLDDLPIEMTAKQRTTTVVPGSDAALRLTIDDITGGQVIASLVNSDGGSVLAATSMAPRDSATFKFGSETYQLTLKELNNALVGEDFARFVVSSGTVAQSEREKIERLLTLIEEAKDDVFIRNGKEYSAKEAADHLRAKWNAAGGSIATAEDFIDEIAAKSSLTGNPYRVRVASGDELLASDYLREKLAQREDGGD
jgi:hypothetical protein